MAGNCVGLCWIVATPLLTALLMTAVLLTPALAEQAFLYLPVAAALGFLYSLPLARTLSRFLQGPGSGDALLRWGWGL